VAGAYDAAVARNPAYAASPPKVAALDADLYVAAVPASRGKGEQAYSVFLGRTASPPTAAALDADLYVAGVPASRSEGMQAYSVFSALETVADDNSEVYRVFQGARTGAPDATA
jgi:hypothetical protein